MNGESASSGPAFALWRPEGLYAAIGLAQDPNQELDVDTLRRDGAGLIRRQSGGGSVILCPGILCWEAWATLAEVAGSFAGGADPGIRQAYACLSRPVSEGLKRLGVWVFPAGICDISITSDNGGEARKMAGMAQLRRRDRVLVHGSILVDPDLGLLTRYLKIPSEQPEYRRGRSHRDFCLSVAEKLRQDSARGEALIARLAGAIADSASVLGWVMLAPPPQLESAAAELENGKYRSEAWNWERKRDLEIREF